MRVALVVLLLVNAGSCASAKPPTPPANPDFTCVLAHRATDVASLRNLPPAIQTALHGLAGEMADRGEFFNATDVVEKPAPFARFIRGGRIGGTWYVWSEHGGVAYWKKIALFEFDSAGMAHLRANVFAHGGDLCTQTDRLLDSPAK